MKRRMALSLSIALLLSGAGSISATQAMASSAFMEQTSDACHGGANATGHSYWLHCEQQTHGHERGGPLGGGDRDYEFVWLPSCPNALPGQPGSESIDCPGAHDCDDPTLISQTLFAQILDNTGKVIKPWWYLTSACRDRSKLGFTKQRILHWSDIRAAIRRIGVPRADVKGPEYTLVNLETTFYTDAATLDRTLNIIGFEVEVHITPSSFIWQWGDGTTTTTHTPGRPYPERDVTHTYLRATTPDHSLPLRVDVAYQAQFRVDGGEWITVNDQLVIGGRTRYLPVKQASAVLVPPR